MLAVVLCVLCVPVRAETREYLLGDIDGFVYNGVGSADDVYVDPAWQNWIQQHYSWSLKDFDILEPDQMASVLFSFSYDLAPDEQVIGATLTLGLRSTIPVSEGGGGGVFITHGGGVRPSFNDLNWYPINDTGISVRSVDLANIAGYNVMPDLQSGLFDAAVRGVVAVDYAQLTLQIVPEPVSVLLFAGGMLFARRLSPKN